MRGPDLWRPLGLPLWLVILILLAGFIVGSVAAVILNPAPAAVPY